MFLALGKELPAEPALADLARALVAAVDAIKARGKAEFGNKTMLDVLGPVADGAGERPRHIRQCTEDRRRLG